MAKSSAAPATPFTPPTSYSVERIHEKSTGYTGIVIRGHFKGVASPIQLLKMIGQLDDSELKLANHVAKSLNALAAHQALYEALSAAEKLFEKGGTISRFDWGKSALRAQDCALLNELPGKIRAALALADAAKEREANGG